MTSGANVVGRDAEVEQVGRFIDGLEFGSRTLLIEGEIGIGKTTLIQRAGEMVGERGHTLLTAMPVESELPLEFAALADLLEAVPESLIAQLPGPQQQAVEVSVRRRRNSVVPVDARTIATANLGSSDVSGGALTC